VTGGNIRRAQAPTAMEAAERETQLLAGRLLDVLGEDGWARYRGVVESMLDDHDPVDIAAAAIAMASSSRKKTQTRATETPPPPENTRARKPTNAHAPSARERKATPPPPNARRMKGRHRP